MVDKPPAWLSAQQAAALLGVKRTTLYAYVSRGQLRSRAVKGTRARRYHRGDLERLRARHAARAGHGAVAASALRWGEPVLDSAITEIRADGPHYRGHRSVALAADGVPFEAVARLLWSGELCDGAEPFVALEAASTGHALVEVLPGATTPLDALMVALPVLALHDPRRFALGAEAAQSVASSAIAQSAALVALPRGRRAVAQALKPCSVAARLLTALGVRPTRAHTAAMDQALVLCADHELNASAFAARVAGSAEADLYACFGAALSTFSGAKHGSAGARVEALLEEVSDHARPGRAVSERLRRGESIAGFGHPLYPGGDPRAAPLLDLAERMARGRRLSALHTLLDAMELLDGQAPNLDTGLVGLCMALGLPRGAASVVFAVGRMAGWAAHAMEQREQGFLLRPRARYVGPGGVLPA